MKAIKVDEAHRVRLTGLKPGDYYVPQGCSDGKSITLYRVDPPDTKEAEQEPPMALSKVKDRWSVKIGNYETEISERQCKALIEAVFKWINSRPVELEKPAS